jgi:hypothetical protein
MKGRIYFLQGEEREWEEREKRWRTRKKSTRVQPLLFRPHTRHHREEHNDKLLTLPQKVVFGHGMTVHMLFKVHECRPFGDACVAHAINFFLINIKIIKRLSRHRPNLLIIKKTA